MKLFHVSYIAVWVSVLFQGFLALALLRYLGELRDLMKQAWGGAAEEDFREDDFLPAGGRAPEFAGFDARSGKPIRIRRYYCHPHHSGGRARFKPARNL
jgi:hypothetical protein